MATFTLNQSVLGSGDMEITDTITPGRGLSIQLEYSQGDANRDMELAGYTLWVSPGTSPFDATLGSLAATSDIEIRTVATPGRGRRVQLEYAQGGVNQDMEIVGYTMWVHPGAPRFD